MGEATDETRTYWNGEPCEARKVTVVMADAPEFPQYWGRHLVGTQRSAVEVVYGPPSRLGRTFYLDDVRMDEAEPEEGPGWFKVTEGRGSPRWPHREVHPVPGSVRPR